MCRGLLVYHALGIWYRGGGDGCSVEVEGAIEHGFCSHLGVQSGRAEEVQGQVYDVTRHVIQKISYSLIKHLI